MLTRLVIVPRDKNRDVQSRCSTTFRQSSVRAEGRNPTSRNCTVVEGHLSAVLTVFFLPFRFVCLLCLFIYVESSLLICYSLPPYIIFVALFLPPFRQFFLPCFDFLPY